MSRDRVAPDLFGRHAVTDSPGVAPTTGTRRSSVRGRLAITAAPRPSV